MVQYYALHWVEPIDKQTECSEEDGDEKTGRNIDIGSLRSGKDHLYHLQGAYVKKRLRTSIIIA